MDRAMAAGQGAVYVISGVWPVLHLPSFERITGPKVDGWLVKTVGAVLASIGLSLLAGARRSQVPAELALLGACSAASLAAVDVVYVTKRRISPIYLADAVMELGFVAGWALAASRRTTERAPSR